MRCPYCGKETTFRRKVCSSCNADISRYRKIVSISNKYYNDAIYKARVRDLSGAIVSLKNSLQVNKLNTNARNLLGLIYLELGETVLALSQWVISKNYQDENNRADYYLKIVQSNASQLSEINANIKKFNYALSQANAGNFDVAILQLKKVISAEPRYLKAHQLLALLYMQKGDNEKAARGLRKAQQIDISNTTTLRYLAELGLNPSAVKVEREIAKRNQIKGQKLENAEEPQFASPGPILRDGKINKWSFIYLCIGLAIGFLSVVFLVLPNRENAIVREYNAEAVEMAEEQSNLLSQIQTLENDKDNLNTKISELNDEIKTLQEAALDVVAFNKFLKGVNLYISGEEEEAAALLIEVNIDKFDSKQAKAVYTIIADNCFDKISKNKTREGYRSYLNRRYPEAISTLKEALKYNKDNDQAIYYMGLALETSGNKDKAMEYYTKLVDNYVTSSYYKVAQNHLNALTVE